MRAHIASPRHVVLRLASALCLAAGVASSLHAAPVTAPRPGRPDGPGQLLRTSGVSIWYEVRGGGPGMPLMVLNGGPGVPHTYMLVSDTWDVLAGKRKVVFYDQRGVGRSPALSKTQSCTLADQIADLEALRSQLGFDRMDVLGHSWGGMLAMAYAARYPDRIGHLILCDSGAPKWDDTKFLFKDIFPEGVDRQDGLNFNVTLGDTVAQKAQFREYQSMLAVAPELRKQLRDGPLPSFVASVNTAIRNDLQQFDLHPELPKFRFPTLVLTGRFDANVAPSVAWNIHQLVPGSQFTVFERSGHLPFFEEPEAFVERVESFLAGR